ncbi:hypothetical protein [Pseudobacter ginsenosidimutans]|uniref:Uncharacterized protein n=1 Tax=Pseudobacter ginsenosidimutans TaxID=661488 RepID=A0A4Q7N1Z4_9BACT|nr:hypothetical protein [Pseudobacter ginsenosidimutans]QEC44015.1 hypothetical protein FSB84_20895 [Pseudobacter ginsenosidimutans]RZS75453.1 hypothetical protein EV199_1319 [Pseudobacter ginsenosidimutans]
MKNLLSIIFVLFCLSSVNSQQTIKDHSKSIKEQAEKMGELLVKKEYDSFARYNHPTILEMMGGKQKMIEVLEKSINEMEAEGISFTKVSFGQPSTVIPVKNELQCTVPQEIEMKMPNGRMVTKSTLIAVSEDNGKTWWFLDTAGKDISVMKQILPNLSSKIVIPEKEEPVIFKDEQ